MASETTAQEELVLWLVPLIEQGPEQWEDMRSVSDRFHWKHRASGLRLRYLRCQPWAVVEVMASRGRVPRCADLGWRHSLTVRRLVRRHLGYECP